MKKIVADSDPKTEIQLSCISGKDFYVIQDSDYGRNLIFVLKDRKVSLDFHLNGPDFTVLNSIEELKAKIQEWFGVPFVSFWQFETEKELIDWRVKN